MGMTGAQQQDDGQDSKVPSEFANNKIRRTPFSPWPEAQGHLQSWQVEITEKYKKYMYLGTHVHYNYTSSTPPRRELSNSGILRQ